MKRRIVAATILALFAAPVVWSVLFPRQYDEYTYCPHRQTGWHRVCALDTDRTLDGEVLSLPPVAPECVSYIRKRTTYYLFGLYPVSEEYLVFTCLLRMPPPSEATGKR